MIETLKACPFCGGKPYVHRDNKHFWVACSVKACRARTEYFTSIEYALSAWNKGSVSKYRRKKFIYPKHFEFDKKVYVKELNVF